MVVQFLPTKKIDIRNEVDRFGFSYVLSGQFGLAKTPRSFACFQHGWIWRKDLRVEDMGYYWIPRNTPIIVATTFQKDTLLNAGFRKVSAGGLPFAYINRSDAIRRLKSLLIMPPHSMRHNKISGINQELLNFIELIGNEFSEICCCLHGDDAKDQEVVSLLKRRNIEVIVGADANDANSLYRMRQIFDYYDYVTTTVMGSHILYAAFCGCRVSLLRKHQFIYPKHTFDANLIIKSISGCAERYLDTFNNKEKLESQFPWLFVNHPKEAIQMTDWARKEIGVDNLLERKQLMNLLGWTVITKIKALIRIALTRFIDSFRRTVSG